MKIVVDKYPVDCYDCPLSKMDYSRQQKVCGVNFERHTCRSNFISFSDMMDQYNIEKNLEKFEKEAEAKKKLDEIIEKKSLNLKDTIETNIPKGIDEVNKLMDGIPKRSEEELKKQREEALSKASKGGFLDTGEVVSIGEEIRKIKDRVREMGANIHHDNGNKVEDTGDKTLTKEQAAEMMCENFGGLV